MKKGLFTLLVILVSLAACKNDKTLCFQSTNTFDYKSLNQYDTSVTQVRVCLKESLWEGLVIEDTFDSISGDYHVTGREAGSKVTTYFNTKRNDTVTRTTETISVEQ